MRRATSAVSKCRAASARPWLALLTVSFVGLAPAAIAETHSVIINYEALDRLPRQGFTGPAPKLTPLSMVKRRTRPTSADPLELEVWPLPHETLAALENPPAMPIGPPLDLAPPSFLDNSLDREAAERLLAAIMGGGLTGATVQREDRVREERMASLEATPLARLEPPPLRRTARPIAKPDAPVPLSEERLEPSPLSRAQPSGPASDPGYSTPTSLPTAAPPPLIAWNEDNPLGAVKFTGDGVGLLDIDRSSLAELDALARRLAAAERRVLLKAFAGSASDKSYNAHVLALRRGLAVRRYLIAKGVPSTLIDVRAAGGATDGGPLNRVDVVPAAS